MLAGGKVYDDVVAGLAEQAQGLVIGDTLAAETTLGPVNSGASAIGSRAFSSGGPSAPRS